MAPGAKWFAARGLGEQGGTDGMLLSSLQYMAAPKVPTPGVSPGVRRNLHMGADVVSNSWGSDNGLSMSYANALHNMAAMGIVNVFAAGNHGEGGNPGTIGSPASSPDILTVGATDVHDKPAEFSSRGPNPLPSPTGDPSPAFAAPGVNDFSSVPGGKFESGWDGTSMATPLVAGNVTLIEQAAKQATGRMFDVNAVRDVLKAIAQDVGPKGPDTATGYGIPAIPKNLNSIVVQVAKARGLMPATPPKAAGRAAGKPKSGS
jgi:bacillopeptidase F